MLYTYIIFFVFLSNSFSNLSANKQPLTEPSHLNRKREETTSTSTYTNLMVPERGGVRRNGSGAEKGREGCSHRAL